MAKATLNRVYPILKFNDKSELRTNPIDIVVIGSSSGSGVGNSLLPSLQVYSFNKGDKKIIKRAKDNKPLIVISCSSDSGDLAFKFLESNNVLKCFHKLFNAETSKLKAMDLFFYYKVLEPIEYEFPKAFSLRTNYVDHIVGVGSRVYLSKDCLMETYSG